MDEKAYLERIHELEETTRELADQLKLVFETEKKFQETKRRLEKEIFRYKILQKISELVASSLDLEETVTFVVSKLVSDLECEKAVIIMLEEDKLTPRFWNGYTKAESATISQFSFSATDGLIGRVCKEKTAYVHDYDSPDEKSDIQSLVSSFFIDRFQLLPLNLIRENRIVGVMLIGNSSEKRNIYTEKWGESDSAIFLTLANQIANVIENSHLYMRLLRERVELKRTKEELERLNESLNQMVIHKTNELRDTERKLTTAKEQLITFNISAEQYSTFLFQVREVLEKKEILKVPSYPDFIDGVAMVRGHILLVVKLHILLGLPEQETPNKQIMVVETHKRTLGFIVDSIEGIESVYRINIMESPPYLRTTNKLKLVTHIVKISEHKIAGLLNLFQLVESLPIGDISLEQFNSFAQNQNPIPNPYPIL